MIAADSLAELLDSKPKDPCMYFCIPKNSNRPSTLILCNLDQSLNESLDSGIEISILRSKDSALLLLLQATDCRRRHWQQLGA
jgi:hypothetical protein